MRKLLCCTLPHWGLTLAGLAAVVLALAAWHLGIDNNPVMGPRRILLLVFGLGTLFLAHRASLRVLLRRGMPTPPRPIETDALSPEPGSTGQHEADVQPGRAIPSTVLLPIILAVLGIYIWLFTAGKWTYPPAPTTYYYDMLAEAFASGQLSLKQAPDPRLARLSNPYDPAQRAGIPRCGRGTIGPDCFPLDVSYFNRNYYLYWGPAPGALLALGKLIGLGQVGDNTVALAGGAGLFLFLSMVLVNLWRRYFARHPRWLLVLTVLLAGLAYPLPWVLDTPLVYEAAILQASAFLVAGLVFAVPTLTSSENQAWRLALTGALWGLSFATRIVLALPVFAFTLTISWALLRARRASPSRAPTWGPLVALTLPLLVAALLIGAYNFARFSDPMESGWRYALAGDGVQFEGIQAVFKWGNVPVNFYNYLLGPASTSEKFPFLESLQATRTLGPFQIPHPDLFHAELVTGLFISTPFLVFAPYLLWSLVCGTTRCTNGWDPRPAPQPLAPPGLRHLVWSICLASVAAFLPIMALYAITARYLLDVSPLLVILAVLGAWVAYAAHRRTSWTRLVAGSAIVATSVVSTVASLLLALNKLSH